MVAHATGQLEVGASCDPGEHPLDSRHSAGLDAAWSVAADSAGRSGTVVKQMTRSCTDDI